MISHILAGTIFLTIAGALYAADKAPIVVGSTRLTSHFYVQGPEECPNRLWNCRAAPVRPPAEFFDIYREALEQQGFRVVRSRPKSGPFYITSAHHTETTQNTCTVEGGIKRINAKSIRVKETYTFRNPSNITQDANGRLQLTDDTKREVLSYCLRSFAESIAKKVRKPR